jgi:hypothetical protein
MGVILGLAVLAWLAEPDQPVVLVGRDASPLDLRRLRAVSKRATSKPTDRPTRDGPLKPSLGGGSKHRSE